MNLIQLVNMIRSSGPEKALQQMAGQNPLAAQAMKMIEGKSPQQINQIAANMAMERGVDINALTQQIRQMLGM